MGNKSKVGVGTRDTLLEDYIGRVVVCHLQGGVVKGKLLRVARYEVELDVGGRVVVLFKHALTHVSVMGSSIQICRGFRLQNPICKQV